MSEETGAAAPPPEEESLVRIVMEQARAVWKQRYLVLAVAMLTATAVALWTLRQPKIYSASASIEFDPTPPRPLGHQVEEVGADEESYYWATREYYTTQFRVMESNRVAEGVVRQLGLQHDADFLGVPQKQRRAFRSVSVTDAAGALRGRYHVEPVRDSRLVTIVVEDTSARRAQLLANTIAAVYIRQNLENKLSTTVSALEWLGQQLETLRTQLEQSEMELHEYRRQNSLLSVSFEDRRNHVANRIQKLSEALTEAQTHRIEVSAHVAELRHAANADDPLIQQAPELLASALLQSLRENYELARRERDALGTRYGRNSREMLAAESKVAELMDAIRHEVRNVLGAAEANLRGIRHIEGDLQSTLNQAQTEALELNLREIQYGRMLRERDNNAKLYALVLERTKETDLTRLLRVNNVRILDPALLPGAPIKPRTTTNVLMGCLGGIFFGIALALALVQLDRTVRSPRDIEEVLKTTFLGLIPRISGRGNRRKKYGKHHDEGPITNLDLVVHTHPNSAIAEACRVIRTNLHFMSPDEPFVTLMVASASPQEGKTTVAMSVALTLAQSGKRVLLIDTDLRRPRVHKVFKIRPPVGITSLLVNEATLDEAVVESEIPNLSLLCCGPIPPNPAELLHSQRFHDVLAQARGKFDRIVLDTPPVGAVSDALIIGPQVDGVVFVVRGRSTVRARAAAALAQLRSLGARVAGVVLNDFDLGKEGGEGYYYYYAQTYEYSSQEDAA